MLRIVVDSAADMPAGWADQYGIDLMPLSVNFGGEELYTEGPGFTKADFYRMVREKRKIPKTSLPSIGHIQAFYRSIACAGDTILSIHVSGRLSGTVQTVQAAAQDLAGDFKIFVFDSEAGSAAQAFMAREARLMERTGAAMPEILRRLEWVRRQIAIIFTIDTLDFAVLSGRINALQSLLAAALKVKPIIVLCEGLLSIGEKVRTRQRALDRVIQMMQERLGQRRVNLAVVHAADPQMGQALFDRARSLFNVQEAMFAELSIVVASHLGPGAIGIVAYAVEEEKE